MNSTSPDQPKPERWYSRYHHVFSPTALLSALTVMLLGVTVHAQSPVSNAPGIKKAAAEETVTLSPFEVIADPSDNYQALNTNSIGGINRSLDSLPITAEIFNATMMKDLGTSNVLELLGRFTGLSFGATGAGPGTLGSQSGDSFSMQGFQVRGLSTFPRRNGFLYFGNVSEGFAYERLEVIRGPQSLLFGNNPPGGVINVVTKKASFGRNFSSLEARVDSNNSARFLLDTNVAGNIMGRKAALKLSLVNENRHFWRENLGRDTQGVYAEAAFELLPASDTSLRLEFEDRSDLSIQARPQNLISGIPAIVPNNTALAVLLARKDPALAQIANGVISWENVDSLAGNARYQNRWEGFMGATLSSKLTSWLQGKLIVQQNGAVTDSSGAGSFTNLRPPLLGGNPINAWAVGNRPGGATLGRGSSFGSRLTLTAKFKLTRLTENQLVVGAERTVPTENRGGTYTYNYYQVDANGNFVVNPALINNADAGRTLIPVQWTDITANLGGFVDPRRPSSYTVGGVTYRLAQQKNADPSRAAPGNPLGFNGGVGGVSIVHGASKGGYAALFTDWFSGKFQTLLGARRDVLYQEQLHAGLRTTGGGNTGNVGVVWNASPNFSFYAGGSSSFAPGGVNFQTQIDGGTLPNGRGQAVEGGLKLHAFDGRLSGSVTVYNNAGKNQIRAMPAADAAVIDPPGLNGRKQIQSPSFPLDLRTSGLEITVSAKPSASLRMMRGYSVSAGKVDRSVIFPLFYNDEFRVNAQGQVTLADGTPLRVPVSPTTPVATDGKTYAASIPTQIMTVGILRSGDSNGNYKAQLQASNGLILNASALGLSVSGVGTGRVGVPINQHQLGFVPPSSTFLESQGGERTSGYPRQSFTATSMYEVKSGALRGLGLGVNGRIDVDTISYYYNDLAAGNIRKPYWWKNNATLNLIARYDWKLAKRWTWTTQINVNNALDTRKLEIYPDVAVGTPANAALRNDPRTWVWTNTLHF